MSPTSNNAFFSYSQIEFNYKENSGKRDGNKRMRNLLSPLNQVSVKFLSFLCRRRGSIPSSYSLKVVSYLLVVGSKSYYTN